MYYQVRQNKYNNVTTTYNGYSYASKKEAAYAEELDWRLKAKEFKSWERQIPISININGHHICTSRVDFLIHHHDGTKEYVEVKGQETPEYRLKKKLIEAVFLHDNPDCQYTLVK